MHVRVLGCHGGEYLHFQPISLLVDGRLLLDAGGAVSHLALDDLLRIEAIAVSHPHLDHIKDIAFLADIVADKATRPTVVASVPDVLDPIRRHFLNDVIWPDFTRIPDPARPVLRYETLANGRPARLAGLTVTPIGVHHQVDGVGFIVEDGGGALLYTGDTGPTHEIWEAAARRPDLRAIFVEASFPERLRVVAGKSGHLTPRLVAAELTKLAGRNADVPVFIYHVKPWHLDEVTRDLDALGDGRIRMVTSGEEIHL
jgi:3',5'-cyclic-nucleotide phosphodiesterase